MSFWQGFKAGFTEATRHVKTVTSTAAVTTKAAATATASKTAHAASKTAHGTARVGRGVWGVVRGWTSFVRGLVTNIPRQFGAMVVVNEILDLAESLVVRARYRRYLKKALKTMAEYPEGSEPYRVAKIQVEVYTKALKRRTFKQFLKDLPQRIMRKLYRAGALTIGATYLMATAILWAPAWAFFTVYTYGVVLPIHAVRQKLGKFTNWDRFMNVPTKVMRIIHKSTLAQGLKLWRYGIDLSPLGLDEQISIVANLNAEKFYNINRAKDAYKKGQQDMAVRGYHDRVVHLTEVSLNADQFPTEYLNGLRDGASWFEKDLALSF